MIGRKQGQGAVSKGAGQVLSRAQPVVLEPECGNRDLVVLVASDWVSVTSWLLGALLIYPFCETILGAALYGLFISVGCIGKSILWKTEKLPRPIQSSLFPFLVGALRLFAHFHAPLKFLHKCKVRWHPVLRSSKGSTAHKQRAATTRSPKLTPSLGSTVAQGKDSSQICFFIFTCLCVNLFIVD